MKIVALAGGVGGSKLAFGLSRLVTGSDLTVIVNTGDDFDYWGLRICPDLDTVTYTLAGLANTETGWGRKNETWNVLENMKFLGRDGWFNVGDKDLSTHIVRTQLLRSGITLSMVQKAFCEKWNIDTCILPMTDEYVSTMIDTLDLGELSFQSYFVKNNCQPAVKGIRFDGIDKASPAPGLLKKIEDSDAIVICPSNPWVSIDPILKINGISTALKGKRILAVSPIINGQTIKGPAAKMYRELGFDPSASSVAMHYRELITDFILDIQDSSLESKINDLGINSHIIDTIMRNDSERIQLAQFVLNKI